MWIFLIAGGLGGLGVGYFLEGETGTASKLGYVLTGGIGLVLGGVLFFIVATILKAGQRSSRTGKEELAEVYEELNSLLPI